MPLLKTVNEKRIYNVAFINVTSKAVRSKKVFTSIVVVSCTDVPGSDKHASLLQEVENYCCRMF